jgi:hypothetical protein
VSRSPRPSSRPTLRPVQEEEAFEAESHPRCLTTTHSLLPPSPPHQQRRSLAPSEKRLRHQAVVDTSMRTLRLHLKLLHQTARVLSRRLEGVVEIVEHVVEGPHHVVGAGHRQAVHACISVMPRHHRMQGEGPVLEATAREEEVCHVVEDGERGGVRHRSM